MIYSEKMQMCYLDRPLSIRYVARSGHCRASSRRHIFLNKYIRCLLQQTKKGRGSFTVVSNKKKPTFPSRESKGSASRSSSWRRIAGLDVRDSSASLIWNTGCLWPSSSFESMQALRIWLGNVLETLLLWGKRIPTVTDLAEVDVFFLGEPSEFLHWT